MATAMVEKSISKRNAERGTTSTDDFQILPDRALRPDRLSRAVSSDQSGFEAIFEYASLNSWHAGALH